MSEQKQSIRVGVMVASLDILGGQAIAALRLLEGLSHSANIAAELLPINPRLPKPLRWLQRIKYVRTLVTFAYYVITLLVKVPRFDVLHVFSASNFSFLLAPAPAVLIGKLYGKRVIVNYHSGEAEAHLRNWRRTALPILRLADRLIVPSGFLVEVFARFGLKAQAIYNTIDLSKFRFHRHHPLRPVMFSNRNFENHYNVACALRAFALVQQQLPEARLIVAGDGSQRLKLHALAAELKLRNTEFIGAVAPETMAGLYDLADIYVNSSVVDNMPLSILEAFACGLAVVTTNAGGIPFVVENGRNGLVVESGDAQALAAGVLRLLENQDEADRLIMQARQDCQRYTWEVVGHQWVALYEELVETSAALYGRPSVVAPYSKGDGLEE
ncbi:MAG: glycosyltransferase family 4 protein [Acidobacteria bacterium]|nr:glycosyltransferase family 4 protein [Acidobacteriota bacterium]